jgi:predicted N-acetyltransferase YhbS
MMQAADHTKLRSQAWRLRLVLFCRELKIRMNTILLRNTREADYAAVESLTREAFWNRYFPGCNEHYLIHVIRCDAAYVRALDFVAESGGKIIGSIVYTTASIIGDDGASHAVLSFGPVSVLPAFQGKGVGSILIEHTIALAKGLGFGAILIYGDPDYYRRFGFVAAQSYGIATADNMYMPALQALELVGGALKNIAGRFVESEVYNVDAAAANAFDEAFPPKELLGDLPSQVKFRKMLELRVPRS